MSSHGVKEVLMSLVTPGLLAHACHTLNVRPGVLDLYHLSSCSQGPQGCVCCT